MLKFKFDYLDHSLSYQTSAEDFWSEITETFEGHFGSQGFQLNDGWITFTIYGSKIRAFYKQTKLTDLFKPSEIAYFRKDLPKQAPVIFEFTSADQVEKAGNYWVKKGGRHG